MGKFWRFCIKQFLYYLWKKMRCDVALGFWGNHTAKNCSVLQVINSLLLFFCGGLLSVECCLVWVHSPRVNPVDKWTSVNGGIALWPLHAYLIMKSKYKNCIFLSWEYLIHCCIHLSVDMMPRQVNSESKRRIARSSNWAIKRTVSWLRNTKLIYFGCDWLCV